MTNRVNMRLSLVMTATALVTLAGGCDDRSTPADKAIHAQAREMTALSADGPAPAALSVEKATLAKVNSELTPAVSSSISGEKSAASMLTGQSNLNLAEHAMGEAGLAERDCGIIITEIDGYLNKWRSHQAMKVAAESFNPSAELAEIATRKTAKDGEIAKERANKAKLEATFNELKGKAKDKMDAVANREAEYGKLMEQAARLSATQGVSLVEQANGVRREADLLRMAGTKLEAQAGVIEPQVHESEAIINQLVNQKKDMEATEAALAAQVSERKDEAAKAGAAANEVAGQITSAMGRLKEAREKTETAYNGAQSLYTKALAAAREASRESPTSGKAMVGDAYVGSGFMQWQHSQGLRLYAALLGSLAKVEPALSDREKFASEAKSAGEDAAKAIASASDALEQASTSFEGVRAQGAGKERLTKLAELLKSAMSVSKDTSTTVSPELAKLAGMNAPPSTMSATSSSGGEASAANSGGAGPMSTIETLVASMKSNDMTGMLNAVQVPEAMKPIVQAFGRLDGAFRARFGKSLMEAGGNDMKQMGGMANAGALAALKNMNAADFKIETAGDTAKAVSGGTTINLKNINGKWMIVIPELEGPQAAMMAPMMAPMATAMNDVAADIEAGKIADIAAAEAALQTKMQEAMQKMMGGMQMPKGPKSGGG